MLLRVRGEERESTFDEFCDVSGSGFGERFGGGLKVTLSTLVKFWGAAGLTFGPLLQSWFSSVFQVLKRGRKGQKKLCGRTGPGPSI